MRVSKTDTATHSRANPAFAARAKASYFELLNRSAVDPAFREKLLTTPRAALAEFTGREVPNTVNIVFVENTADATIVLPNRVAANAELSEHELEAVAGGTGVLSLPLAAFVLADAIQQAMHGGDPAP